MPILMTSMPILIVRQNSFVKNGGLKIRAYHQIFSLFLRTQRIEKAMLLFRAMKIENHWCPIEPELFVQLIAAMAENGHFW